MSFCCLSYLWGCTARWSERGAAGIQLSGNGLRVVPWIVYAPSGCFVDGERAAVV